MNKKIFIPGVSGGDLKFLDKLLEDPYPNLSIVMFLIAWRTQLTSTLNSLLTTAEIQQLESAKLNSRIIYTLGKPLAAAISVNRTLGYEAASLKEKESAEEREKYLSAIVEDLVENDAPTGSAILKPAQLNNETITKHRYGIISSLIGKWQSKPIFEPGSVIVGMPPSTVKIEDVITLSRELYQIIYPTTTWKLVENDVIDIQDLIKTTLESPKTFNDGIYISTSNILPLEEGLEITRSAPTNYPTMELAPEETDELLKIAVSQQNELANSSKRKKAVFKSKTSATSETNNSPQQGNARKSSGKASSKRNNKKN